MKPFRRRMLGSLATAALLGSRLVSGAIPLDLTSSDSIKSAASTIAADTMAWYTGWQPGGTPGNLPAPYYWWEAGAFMGVFVDYWYFTGDSQYNDKVMQGLLAQVGPSDDYMPPNQTKTEGNDDQAFWGMAVLSAAEQNFPNPPEGSPQWLALAQAVFNTQAVRWDTTTCGGGLKWQIYSFNTGYNYKNTISNGCFMNMAARLAVYTNNDTYAVWADRMWDWASGIGLIGSAYEIYDGTDDNLNCTEADHIRWTYNTGTFLLAAANMYNYTGGSQLWADRVNGLIQSLPYFFQNNVMMESACENIGTCDVDQQSFKTYLSRWMAATMIKAPFTVPLLLPYLQASAQAAVNACSGGTTGTQCGLKWTTNSYDGLTGIGEQMAALSVVQSNLYTIAIPPVTATSGGTSKGNPSAGTNSVGPSGPITSPITTADKAGAGILTTLAILTFIGGAWWMVA